MSLVVDFEPLGRRVPCDQGDTLLDAAQRSGILLNATCGGEGICGQCKLRVLSGQISNPNDSEESELGLAQTRDNWRLACQTRVFGDVHVHIPPESLATSQRIQTEGRSLPIELDPVIRLLGLRLPPPDLSDLRSDADRLRGALNMPGLQIPLPLLRTLSDDLRENEFQVRATLRDSALVGVGRAGTPALGFAADLGTTKLAGYLVDLSTGETLASGGAMNPQIAFGEDVMARINHAMSKREGGEQLRGAIVHAVKDLATSLCAQVNASTRDIADAVVVGNTAMHHLFLGLPVRQLGLAPYVPAESAALDDPAHDLGLDFAPGANVYVLPNIAGFVGADHVAMLLGSGMLEREGSVLGIDIGTNTEISLIAEGRHYACSTASGPAFEGAHIQHGMRAAPGAIERVVFHDGKFRLQTVDGRRPVGLCGSGILDLVAQMRRAGIISARGGMNGAGSDSRIRKGQQGDEFVLLTAEENEGREITFSRKDVNEIQLAKGAVRAGINVLLRKAGIEEGDIDAVIMAGAFGTYLDVQSGIDIGMLPRIGREKFVQVGNAAGAGARMALLSKERRRQAVELARHVEYVELTAVKEFSSLFAKALLLE